MSNVNEFSSSSNSYDYIIAGAGGAGLSLLYYIISSPKLNQKKVLVIDQCLKKSNDRTWCFWEIGKHEFESLVHHQWDTISIHAGCFSKDLPTMPFYYKMVQGIDFYNHIIALAKANSNIHWLEATISQVDSIINNENQKEAVVYWEGGVAKGKNIFTSILPFQMNHLESANSFDIINRKSNKEPFLWQHFKGITVSFDQPVLNNKVARLMDFNVPQYGATAFMYLLPLSNTQALVEYTLFSDKILDIPMYDDVIREYLNQHYPNCSYTIQHQETGAIPMTHQNFSSYESPIYCIGALGLAVKASTGYAFQFIQKQCKQIVAQLEQGAAINTSVHNSRHRFYDAVLLHVLFYHKMAGANIFKRIFAKNKAATVFKFLSNTSTLIEDIQIMRSLPTRIFLPAAIAVLFRRS